MASGPLIWFLEARYKGRGIRTLGYTGHRKYMSEGRQHQGASQKTAMSEMLRDL